MDKLNKAQEKLAKKVNSKVAEWLATGCHVGEVMLNLWNNYEVLSDVQGETLTLTLFRDRPKSWEQVVIGEYKIS